MTKHIPVLLAEALQGAHLKKGSVVVDATFGGGGYSQAILSEIGADGKLIALDRDALALDSFHEKHESLPKNIELVHANFSQIESVVYDRGVVPTAIIADLGISSDQLDNPVRGLSFLTDGPLDMRLDQSEDVTAAIIVRDTDQRELVRIFQTYGDEPYARRIAQAITTARETIAIKTTHQLAEIILGAVPQRERQKKRHPATRVFQALRIAVNHEYDDLEKFLAGALNVLSTGGRLVVVSFHSGEDRIVKHFFRSESNPCVCPPELPICSCNKFPRVEIITKKPIRPTEQEIEGNPRSRSALLRIAQKI